MKKAQSELGRTRRLALLAHRYVGLFLVVFLTVAGLTGTILAFQEELDVALNPELFELPLEERGKPSLEPFELRERIERALPGGKPYRTVSFEVEGNRAVDAWVEGEGGVWRQWFVSPVSGRILGNREWGNLAEGKKNLVPFLYRFHYSLALGDVGTPLFGVAALLWTLDCFVGAYLTFPQRSPRERRGGFFRRWLPMWGLKTNKLFSFVFTWHRASGLWIWALLFVFAWSAVGFNLRAVYAPVMGALVGATKEGHLALPHYEPPYPEPRIDVADAYERGRREMAREAWERGFSIGREIALYYAEDHGVYGYVVESSLDVSKEHPWTEVYVDGKDGTFRGFSAPSGISAGNTISNWLFRLHMGHVFGLWYRIVVAVVGVGVTGLSITGLWIWLRKREKRGVRRARRETSEPEGLPMASERVESLHV